MCMFCQERERSQEQYRVVAVKQVLPDGSLYEGHLGTQGPHGQVSHAHLFVLRQCVNWADA